MDKKTHIMKINFYTALRSLGIAELPKNHEKLRNLLNLYLVVRAKDSLCEESLEFMRVLGFSSLTLNNSCQNSDCEKIEIDFDYDSDQEIHFME
jgi:acetolactate synthase regulatory subunit